MEVKKLPRLIREYLECNPLESIIDEDELESLVDLAKQQGLEPLVEKCN